jgi:hypothetical protein
MRISFSARLISLPSFYGVKAIDAPPGAIRAATLALLDA